MAIIKCKMCGGSLEISEDMSVAECEYCGTKQTVPRIDSDRKANLYDRANHFRRNNDFDKAMGIYESILNEDNTDSEAYWSLVLCRYGIEYVEDPDTRKRVPTVNRAQFTSIFDDEDYKAALKNADTLQRSIYETEAKAINEIQKGILEISAKEEPFDCFISFKETDANGRRTRDAVLAQDLYNELTKEGFKVFFAPVTLEDKLGTAYEPYIFAALNSAKVMVVLGTKPEHFNAVWVKNEWSRYLALIKGGAKKTLIPAYRDMDPYDLPEEFSHLMAQDMSKLGFMQDLIRGIKKIMGADEPKAAAKAPAAQQTVNQSAAPLLKRAFMFLEDGEFDKANDFCEQVLNLDPECAEAYWGKFLAENKSRNASHFVGRSLESIIAKRSSEIACEADTGRISKSVAENKIENYLSEDEIRSLYNSGAPTYTETASSVSLQIMTLKQNMLTSKTLDKAKKFAVGEFKEMITATLKLLDEGADKELANAKMADENAKQKAIADYKAHLDSADKKAAELKAEANAKRKADYDIAATEMAEAKNADEFLEAAEIFADLTNFEDSAAKAEECNIAAENAKNEADYLIALNKQQMAKSPDDFAAAARAFEKLGDYKDSENRKNACLKQKSRKLKKNLTIFGIVAGVIAAIAIVFFAVIKPNMDAKAYNAAAELEANGEFVQAAVAYSKLGDYKDSNEKSNSLWNEITVRETIATGSMITVGLRSTGTVVVAGFYVSDYFNVTGWSDIVAISVGSHHTVGLKSDGRVVATGVSELDDDGRCNVSGWMDIVAISAGDNHTVGLKSDSTVVAVGDNGCGQCDVGDWTDIIAISAGESHTVGLKSDGTVVAVGYNYFGQCDVEAWTDIIAISAHGNRTVGLKSDGTVVTTGSADVDDWTDIVAISAGSCTVGLKSDGTVVTTGSDNVDDWTDIVAISADSYHTVGLKSDGTVVAVGDNDHGQCDVSSWANIKLPS